MFKRNVLKVWFLMLVAIFIVGCSDRAKNEKEIMEDIVEEDFFLSNFDLEITEFEIIKRQTNEDEKSDYVWVELFAENDYFTYENEYELTYELYNEGWLLENIPYEQMQTYTWKKDVIMIDEETIIEDILTEDKYFDENGLTIEEVKIWDADFPTFTEGSGYVDEPTGYFEPIFSMGEITKWYKVDIEASKGELEYSKSYSVSYDYLYDDWKLSNVREY